MACLRLTNGHKDYRLNEKSGYFLRRYERSWGNALPLWTNSFRLWRFAAFTDVQCTRELWARDKEDSLVVFSCPCEGSKSRNRNWVSFLVYHVTDVFRECTPKPVKYD